MQRIRFSPLVWIAVWAVTLPVQAQFIPGDLYYHTGGLYASDPGQWNLRTIEMPRAWSITTGSDDVVVAVIDERADLFHADLQDALWVNPGETSGGGDGDGNGINGDVHGVYIGGTPANPTYSSPHVLYPNPQTHGTSVASIILGQTVDPPQTSGTGMAGVAGGRSGVDSPR